MIIGLPKMMFRLFVTTRWFFFIFICKILAIVYLKRKMAKLDETMELTKCWNSEERKYTVMQIITEMIKKACYCQISNLHGWGELTLPACLCACASIGDDRVVAF